MAIAAHTHKHTHTPHSSVKPRSTETTFPGMGGAGRQEERLKLMT